MPEKKSSSGRNYGKYDDWVCLLCQNHNYSFRTVCNRCHLQTKEYNAYLTLCHHGLIAPPPPTSPISMPDSPPLGPSSEPFPNFVLLMVSNQPWEQQPQRREPLDTPNIKWINNLIEE